MEEINEILLNYIVEDGLILIPVLYIIGEIIKQTLIIKDKWIPLILLFFGVLFSVLLLNDPMINNIIKGILITGEKVFYDQVKKKNIKKKYLILIIKDKWISLILLFFGVLFSVLLLNDPMINNIIQGILITGVTVFFDQVKKQYFEKEY